MTPARTTGAIHGCAQWPRMSVMITCLGRARAIKDSSRTPTSAAMSARVTAAPAGIARYSGGSLASAAAARRRGNDGLGDFARIDGAGPLVCGQRANHVALALEDRRNAPRATAHRWDRSQRPFDSARAHSRTAPRAARPRPGRDTETPTPATPRSPAGRSPRPHPSAAHPQPLSRAPACPASRGTSTRRRGCEGR